MTSPIKFENGANDTPKHKKQTKAATKSKSKTPKVNTAKKIKIEKKTTPKSSSISEKETSSNTKVKEEVEAKLNSSKEEKRKSVSNADGDKKENVKIDPESPMTKKPTGIHSFFTSSKTTKEQSTNGGVTGADYNPGKIKYHPIDDAFWKHAEKYDLRELTN